MEKTIKVTILKPKANLFYKAKSESLRQDDEQWIVLIIIKLSEE